MYICITHEIHHFLHIAVFTFVCMLRNQQYIVIQKKQDLACYMNVNYDVAQS